MSIDINIVVLLTMFMTWLTVGTRFPSYSRMCFLQAKKDRCAQEKWENDYLCQTFKRNDTCLRMLPFLRIITSHSIIQLNMQSNTQSFRETSGHNELHSYKNSWQPDKMQTREKANDGTGRDLVMSIFKSKWGFKLVRHSDQTWPSCPQELKPKSESD